jgi:nicotinamidase-related amidase
VASEPVRDATKDQLLTPHNSAFIVIDYQPAQVNSIASMDRQLLVNNIVGTAKAARTYGLPIVHSTVNVKTGLNKPPFLSCGRHWKISRPTTAPRSTRGKTLSSAKPSSLPDARS